MTRDITVPYWLSATRFYFIMYPTYKKQQKTKTKQKQKQWFVLDRTHNVTLYQAGPIVS